MVRFLWWAHISKNLWLLSAFEREKNSVKPAILFYCTLHFDGDHVTSSEAGCDVGLFRRHTTRNRRNEVDEEKIRNKRKPPHPPSPSRLTSNFVTRPIIKWWKYLICIASCCRVCVCVCVCVERTDGHRGPTNNNGEENKRKSIVSGGPGDRPRHFEGKNSEFGSPITTASVTPPPVPLPKHAHPIEKWCP